MSATITNGYTPAEHFNLVEGLPPVALEAIDDNNELWLIRIPANEIGQADLMDKKLRLNVGASHGKIGHFVTEKGKEYNIVKHGNVDTIQPYAIVPNGSDPFVVRKIVNQVGFVRSLGARANEENSHQLERDTGVIRDKQKSSLTSEKGASHVTSEKQASQVTPEKQASQVTPEKPGSHVIVEKQASHVAFKKQTSVLTTEKHARDVTSERQAGGVPSEEQARSEQDVVEKRSKKKRRRSELSERN